MLCHERKVRVAARHESEVASAGVLDGPMLDPAWEVSEISLEEIVLAYMGMDEPVSAGPLRSVRRAS